MIPIIICFSLIFPNKNINGRVEEAELAKADLLQRSPNYRATGFNMYNDEQLSRTFTEGLLKAGIEHRDQ